MIGRWNMVAWLVAACVAAAPGPAPADAGGASPAAGDGRAIRFPPSPKLPAVLGRELKWRDLAFVPGPGQAEEARKAWSWLVPGRWRPILFAMVGGIFFETEAGTVRWLDMGAGTVEEVAPDVEAFEAILRSGPPDVEYWFLPALVESLHRAGKRPRPGQAYFFLVLPIFKEGRFTADNMVVVPVREQIGATADIHRQIAQLPDGAKAEMKTK